MSKLIGSYTFEKADENLDNYYQALGVPYIARKMMSFSKPKISITNEGDSWSITTSTALRTVNYTFKLGEEYDEDMPGGSLKSITTMEDDSTLKTVSVGLNETKITRTYQLTDEGCVLIYRHDASGTEGRRFFKKI